MKPFAIFALLLGAMFGVGCDRIASETYGKVVGPKGFSADVRPVDERALAKYSHFEIGKFADETNGRAPSSFFAAVPYEFDKIAADRIIQNPSGRTLLIRGRIIHYESSSMASEIFGPLEEVVVRVQFVDKFTGGLIGEAVCVGRTRETLNRGPEKKAEGLARAIVGWLEGHNPSLRQPESD
jgi:hypothetical protein